MDSNTKATLSVKPTGEATFIAFTICPAFESAFKEDRLKVYNISRWDYKEGLFYGRDNAFVANMTGFEIFNDITYELHDMMNYIKVKNHCKHF